MSNTPLASENQGITTRVAPPDQHLERRNGANPLRAYSTISESEQAQRKNGVGDNAQYQKRLQEIFRPGPNGVIGLADDLLVLCREADLQLTWHDGQCHVRTLGEESPEAINIPLQKSVFRALLARISALCDDRSSEPVSPYGGEGRIAIPATPSGCYHVVFSNTKDEQRVEIRLTASATKVL